MKNFPKYLFFAVVAAIGLVSCEKEKGNPLLNPEGSPVKFTFSATEDSETSATLKVVADVPVPADVTISLAADASNTMTEMTFPSELIVKKGETEATCKLTVDKDALTPGVTYQAIIVASLADVPFGKVSILKISIPIPPPVLVDGDPSDWSKLPGDYVTEMICSESAELTGLKSAKVFYDDKLYVILEVSDEALEQGVTDGKLRLHFFFDGDNSKADGYYHKWTDPAIDCMLEGKMTNGGTWCALGSSYYKWTGTDPNVWSGSWTSADITPTFEYAGKDNYYECSMDYSTYPGGLGKVIGMGFDIQDGGYNITGFLPSAGPLAQVVKNGEAIPEEPGVVPVVDGDFSEWKSIPSIPGDGALNVMKMAQTEDMVYFYLEVKKTEDVKLDETMSFAHKIMLCFDNGDGKGEFGGEPWGGAGYDKIVDIWLMQNGVPNMITWGLDGFLHKEADGDDIQKYEFCFKKSAVSALGGDCFQYGAFINTQRVDKSTGTEVWEGEDTARIGSAPALDQPMAVQGELPEPELVTISIDGDMAEWADVAASVSDTDGPILVFKATYDAEYLYFYNKRTWHDGLWGGGYYYFEIDTDNDASTVVADVNGNTPAKGVDQWMYLFLFTGEAGAPTFAAAPEGGAVPETLLTNVIANGATDKTVIETEVRVPRANLGVKKGDIIRVYTWGNKSGGNLKSKGLGIPIRLSK